MNVQIRTAYGEMSFDMTQDKALSLIGLAISYANGGAAYNEPPAPLRHTQDEGEPEPPEAEEKPTAKPAEKPAPRSRLETMFGARAEWNMPAADPKQDTDDTTDDERMWEGRRGFLHIECEACGKVKTYCAKTPQKYHRCECGHANDLHDVRAAHVKCNKCGSVFTYNTNIRRDNFTIDCFHCGSPVDMKLGAKGTAFVTVAEEIRGGAHGIW